MYFEVTHFGSQGFFLFFCFFVTNSSQFALQLKCENTLMLHCTHFSRKYQKLLQILVQSEIDTKILYHWFHCGAAVGHSTTAGWQVHSLQWWTKQHICHHLKSNRKKVVGGKMVKINIRLLWWRLITSLHAPIISPFYNTVLEEKHHSHWQHMKCKCVHLIETLGKCAT